MKTKLSTQLIVSLLLYFMSLSVGSQAQSDIYGLLGVGHAGVSGYYVGWGATTTIPLKISHDGNYEIQMWTSGSVYPRAVIGDASEFSLIVGNQSNTSSSGTSNRLYNNIDVECTVNNFTPAEGYNYSGTLILAAPGTFDNLICGLNAGGSLNSSSIENTMVGSFSGYQNTSGSTNTFLGAWAGFSNLEANENTFTGAWSGYINYTGHDNTFNGAYAGNSNYSGNQNTFLGAYSGSGCYDATNNAFTGYFSGAANYSGDENTFNGAFSGYHNNGAADNTFSGFKSGYTNVTGTRNSFYGMEAGYLNTASDNTFNGFKSGYTNASGTRNAFNGTQAGYLNTASDNTFNGYNAGYTNGSGAQNTFNGSQAGYSNTTASDNTYNGFKSGYSNAAGTRNTFTGMEAGFTNSNSDNTFTGYKSGHANSTGTRNTFSGSQAGYSNTASDNTFEGFNAGYTNNTGNYNTSVGSYASYLNDAGEKNTMVGYQVGYKNNTGNNNTYMGFNAGYTNTDKDNNTCIGYESGLSNVARDNTFIGNQSGRLNTTGYFNTFTGSGSGQSNSTGTYNSFFGWQAGNGNNTGGKNTFLGYTAGLYNTTGTENTYVGYETGTFLPAGIKNTCIGSSAAYTFTTGDENTIGGAYAMFHMSGGDRNAVFGSRAGYQFDTGDDNSFLGYQSGQNNAGGSKNVFLGRDAGLYNSSGSQNTYVGYNSGQQSGGSHALNYSAAIGANAIVRHDKHMILGDNDIYVGIGLSNDPTGPRDELEINSTDALPSPGHSGLYFTDLTTASNVNASAFSSSPKGVLSVDANGKVILVEDQGSGVGDVVACTTGVATNWVTLWSNAATKEICTSEIYDNGTNVDVGYIGAQPINNKLDVNGNINVPVTNSYNIWNAPFLKTNSNAGDVELGFGAGPNVTNTALYSVFVGDGSGYSIANSEAGNVFIGSNAGYNFVASGSGPAGGDYNVCVGYAAGNGAGNSTNGKGSSNVFLGSHAAGEFSNLNQYVENVVVGAQSGNQAIDGGSDNVIIGYNSHIDNSSSTTGTIDNCVVIGNQVTSQSTDAFVCGNGANQILMGYNVTPSSVTSGGPPYSTSTDCKLYVNPRSTSARQDAAYFNGNVLVSTNVYSASDSALKDNIQKLQETNAENLLKQIEPKTYTFNQAHPSIHLAPGLQYGLIAQEVEQVLPGLVTECTAPAILDSIGNQISPQETFKALNYSGFIPLLIASEKDHQDKIDSLKNKIDSLINRDSINNARMDQLEQMINACCSNPGGNATGRIKNPIDVELGSENTIILNQNDPNPFAEQTRITYSVPSDVKEAKIIFFDNSGHVMQTVTINDRGNGQINVYGEKLSSGIYSYSLLADGKVIDTKKMVCNK